jgi:hypothetical protein
MRGLMETRKTRTAEQLSLLPARQRTLGEGRDDPDVQSRLCRTGDVFGDAVVATALLDRLLHHAVVVQMQGSG